MLVHNYHEKHVDAAYTVFPSSLVLLADVFGPSASSKCQSCTLYLTIRILNHWIYWTPLQLRAELFSERCAVRQLDGEPKISFSWTKAAFLSRSLNLMSCQDINHKSDEASKNWICCITQKHTSGSNPLEFSDKALVLLLVFVSLCSL